MSTDPPKRQRAAADQPVRSAELAEAVAAGLNALGDMHRLHPDVISGALERVLRAAAARHERAAAAVALRTACAHLHAGDHTAAYLALRIAEDALPRRHEDPEAVDDDADPSRQAAAVFRTQQRQLRARAILKQSVGVLAAYAGIGPDQASAALCAHAARHGFVLTELASDVVDGRVHPMSVLGTEAAPGADATRRDH